MLLFILLISMRNTKKPITINGRVYTYLNDGVTSGIHQLTKELASKNGRVSYPTTVVLGTNNRIDEQVTTFLSAANLKKLLSTYLLRNKKLTP